MNAAFSALHNFYNQFGEPEQIAISLTPRDRCSPRVNCAIAARGGNVPRPDFAVDPSHDMSAGPGEAALVAIDEEMRRDFADILDGLREVGYFD